MHIYIPTLRNFSFNLPPLYLIWPKLQCYLPLFGLVSVNTYLVYIYVVPYLAKFYVLPVLFGRKNSNTPVKGYQMLGNVSPLIFLIFLCFFTNLSLTGLT